MYVLCRKENNTPTYICAFPPNGSLNRVIVQWIASRARMEYTLLDSCKNNNDSLRTRFKNVDIPYFWTLIVSLL